MKEFRFFFFIITFALLIMCFAYKSRLVPFLLAAVSVMLLMSYIPALITRLCIEVDDEQIKDTAIRRKSEFIYRIRVNNRFFLPVTPLRLYVRTTVNDSYTPVIKILNVNIPPFSAITIDVCNTVSFRGEYKIGLEKFEFFDLLKISKFSVKKQRQVDILSLPRELSLNYIRDDNKEETETSHTKPHGFDRDTFAYLREYNSGESLRHIHWKMSARSDDLIVKHLESSYDYSTLILCDFCVTGTTVEETLEISDSVIETASAIVRKVLQLGNNAQVLWNDSRGDVSPNMVIHDSVSYDRTFRTLSTLPPEPYKGEFSDLFDTAANEFRSDRLIYVIGAITENLVGKLRETGLIYRTNVVVAFPKVADKESLDYLRNETRINVFSV